MFGVVFECCYIVMVTLCMNLGRRLRKPRLKALLYLCALIQPAKCQCVLQRFCVGAFRYGWF